MFPAADSTFIPHLSGYGAPMKRFLSVWTLLFLLVTILVFTATPVQAKNGLGSADCDKCHALFSFRSRASS